MSQRIQSELLTPRDSLPISREVNQERTLARVMLSIFKRALRPFISAYSALRNKCLTGNWLTTDGILPKVNYNIKPGGGATYDISKMNKEIQELQPNSYISFHIGCQRSIPHSTMLIIGKKENGEYYALFFDAQGKAPKETLLLQKEFEIDKDLPYDPDGALKEIATIEINTVEELHAKMMEGIDEAPRLLYSSSYIQADSAAFFKEFEQEFKKPNFNPQTLMQNTANQNLVTFRKARNEVCRVSAFSGQLSEQLGQNNSTEEFELI